MWEMTIFMFLVVISAHNSQRLNTKESPQTVKLSDGKKVTGLEIRLSDPTLAPVIAYFGIRYASLGGGTGGKDENLFAAETETIAKGEVNTTLRKPVEIPSPHRFSHSVASFFYESPMGVFSKTKMPPVCPQPLINLKSVEKECLTTTKERLMRLAPFLENQSEDCLTLNIYVPQLDSAHMNPEKLPVVLFVHGESYEFGTGNAYDLSVLSSFAGAVGITLNYRLGLLGFLSLKNGQSNGNFALFDLHAALMWIETNIARFGGDPDQLTLIGHGYGAALVHLFSLSKLAQGIGKSGIKRLVLLDGSGLASWATSYLEDEVISSLLGHFNITMEKTPPKGLGSHNTTVGGLQKPGFPSGLPKHGLTTASNPESRLSKKRNDTHANKTTSSPPERIPSASERLLKYLKRLTGSKMLELQEKLPAHLYASRLGPIISRHLFPDFLMGNNRGSSRTAMTSYSRYYRKQRELNVGRTQARPETTLFAKVSLLIGVSQMPATELFRRSKWKGDLLHALENLAYEVFPDRNQVISEVLAHLYKNSNWRTEYTSAFKRTNQKEMDATDEGEKIQMLLRILSDGLFVAPSIQTAKLHELVTRIRKRTSPQPGVDDARTYLSVFQHMPSYRVERTPQTSMDVTGIGFGEDLAYMLGAPLVSPNRLDPFKNAYSNEDKRISKQMLSLLSNFIYTGDPNKPNLYWPQPQSESTVEWPEYDAKTQAYLAIGSSVESRGARFEDSISWGRKSGAGGEFVVGYGYRSEQTDVWSQLLPRLAGLPTPTDSRRVLDKTDASRNGHENRTLIPGINSQLFEPWLPERNSVESHIYFLQLRDRQRVDNELGLGLNKNTSVLGTGRYFNRSVHADVTRSQKVLASSMASGAAPSRIQGSQEIFETYSPVMSESVSPTVTNQIVEPLEPEFPGTIFPLSGNSQPIKQQQHWRLDLSPTTKSALLWTIAAGATLFLLNALVFVGIYYQANQLRSDYGESRSRLPSSADTSGKSAEFTNSMRNTVQIQVKSKRPKSCCLGKSSASKQMSIPTKPQTQAEDIGQHTVTEFGHQSVPPNTRIIPGDTHVANMSVLYQLPLANPSRLPEPNGPNGGQCSSDEGNGAYGRTMVETNICEMNFPGSARKTSQCAPYMPSMQQSTSYSTTNTRLQPTNIGQCMLY